MALLGAAAPSSFFSHLARWKDNRWRSRGRLLLPRQRRPESLDRGRALWSGFDLHDFKNGRNISVAEYLNIESKWSPLLTSDPRRTKKLPTDDVFRYPRHLWKNSANWRCKKKSESGEEAQPSNPKPFSLDSLLYPSLDTIALGVDPIISKPSLPDHLEDSCLLQRESRLNILDTSRIDMKNLLNVMEGDLFVLELFEKSILLNDRHTSKLPMLVLSHPKLFNGLVMNPIDIHELVSNPHVWAPILIPQSVASIISALNEKESVLVDLLPNSNLDKKLSQDRLFPSASVLNLARSTSAPISATREEDMTEEVGPGTKEFHSLADASISPSPPSINTRRRVGVIRRLTPKEILHWIRSFNPHLQRTVDRYKYDVHEELEAMSKTLRYPVLETSVAALLPSSPRGANSHVREGNDCVSLFEETNFFSDEFHCQSADSGFASWGVDGELRIFDVESVDGFVLHFGFVNRGTLRVGDRIHLKIDEENRTSISRNHTSAHLLNFGLDQVFSSDSTLDGRKTSRVCRVKPDSLVLEFEGKNGPLEADVARMETLVNLMIYHKVPVHRENISIDDAKSLNVPLSPPVDPLSDEIESLRFSFEFDDGLRRGKGNGIVTSAPDRTSDPASSPDELLSSPMDAPDAALEGVTVVSVGIPASDILKSNRTKDSSNAIGACSLEACSGTHVANTSHIHSFVVTEVERVEAGRSRIKAVTRDGADLALRNAQMIASHIVALESEASAIDDKRVLWQFGEKLDAVRRNLSSLTLPANARSSYLTRVEALSATRDEKETNFERADAPSPGRRFSITGAGIASDFPRTPSGNLADEITRQLVDRILELGTDRPPYHIQHLVFTHPKLVKNGLLLAARQIVRLNHHRPHPTRAAFLLTQTKDRIFCLSHVTDGRIVDDVTDGDRDCAISAQEWMKATLAAVGAPFIGGAINRELNADRVFFATVKTLDGCDEASSLEEMKFRDRPLSSLSRRIEVEARRIVEEVFKSE